MWDKLIKWLARHEIQAAYDEGYEDGQASKDDEIEGAWRAGLDHGHTVGYHAGRNDAARSEY